MTNENLVKRLRKWAESAKSDGFTMFASDLNEAADEIEYLRQRCEQIDQEWRQTLEERK